jgi:hypothetical protein
MAKMNGTLILLKVEGNVIEALTTNSFESSTDMIECTSKSSGRFKEFIPGEMGATISFEGKYNDTGTGANLTMADLMGYYTAGTKIDFVMGGTTASNEIVEGEGYLSDITWDAPQNEITTFSGTIQVSGTWTLDVVS